MVDQDDIVEFTKQLDLHFEWLLIRENGRTFPVHKTEIEIICDDKKTLLGFIGDKGFHAFRIENFSSSEGEINLSLVSNFRRSREKIRLVPRVSAKELSETVELARLEKANQIAALITKTFPAFKLIRVALDERNARLAQIFIEDSSGHQTAVLSDVSESLPPETFLTTSFIWFDKLKLRKKKPINEIWLVAEKKKARALQKIHALFKDSVKKHLTVFEIANKKSGQEIRRLARLKFTDLWREKPKKLNLPAALEISEIAREIIELSPEKIDVIFSKYGETLRFLGLPFARIRKILGKEKAWFGIERDRRVLDDPSRSGLFELRENLERYRNARPPAKRHELYRLSPESWLESILKRNIKLLDANLILSPIYNQFRTSADTIDLLALRKDGRLVVIELKTSPDREMVFQAADYWRKIEQQRRRGELKKAKAFGDLEILDKPALVYTVAPALSFHRDFEYFARMLSKEIELWRFELHENWRAEIKVIARKNYSE